MKYTEWVNQKHWVIRLLMAFPVVDGIFYSIYRICQKTPANVILGILWIPFGALVGWFPDMVHIASGKEIFLL